MEIDFVLFSDNESGEDEEDDEAQREFENSQWKLEEQRRIQLEMEEKARAMKASLEEERNAQKVIEDQKKQTHNEEAINPLDLVAETSLKATKLLRVQRAQMQARDALRRRQADSKDASTRDGGGDSEKFQLANVRNELRSIDRKLALILYEKEEEWVALRDPRVLRGLIESWADEDDKPKDRPDPRANDSRQRLQQLPPRELREVSRLLLQRAEAQQRERELLADDDTLLANLESWRQHMKTVMAHRKRLAFLVQHFRKSHRLRARKKPSRTDTLQGIKQLARYNFSEVVRKALDASRQRKAEIARNKALGLGPRAVTTGVQNRRGRGLVDESVPVATRARIQNMRLNPVNPERVSVQGSLMMSNDPNTVVRTAWVDAKSRRRSAGAPQPSMPQTYDNVLSWPRVVTSPDKGIAEHNGTRTVRRKSKSKSVKTKKGGNRLKRKSVKQRPVSAALVKKQSTANAGEQ